MIWRSAVVYMTLTADALAGGGRNLASRGEAITTLFLMACLGLWWLWSKLRSGGKSDK